MLARLRLSRAQLWHAGLSGALVLAFLLVAWKQHRPRGTFAPSLALHTTENFLRIVLERKRGSESLLHTFDALPPGPVAAVYPEGDMEGLLEAYMVSYLGWPRQVHLRPVPPDGSKTRESLGAQHFVAVYYCTIAPPPDARPVFRLGGGVVLVPASPGSPSP